MAYNNQSQQQQKDVCEDIKNTKQILENCKLELCNDLREAVDNLREAESDYWGSAEVYKYKKCTYLKSHDSTRFYRSIEIVTGTFAAAEAVAVKDKVKKAGDKNTELQKLLKDVAKNVKDAHTKFKALSDAACTLKHCIDDTCNKPQKTLLIDKLKTDNKDWFTETMECLYALSDSMYHTDEHKAKNNCPDECNCDENINEILCFTADVVGMQTFSNIENLPPLEKALTDLITDFHSNVTTNLKATADDFSKAMDDLLKFEQGAVKLKYDVFEKRGLASGTKDTKDFVCDPKCEDVNCKDLCKMFPDTYCGDKDGGSGSEED